MKPAILIETEEGKFLLTEPEVSPSILSFAKSFKATLHSVKTNAKIRNINEVVKALNKPTTLLKRKPKVKQQILLYRPPEETPDQEPNTIIQKDNYQQYLDQANLIKDHIKTQLLKGNTVSLDILQGWATQKNLKLSKGGLSRHLQRILDWAIGQGYSKIKEGRAYRITKTP